MSLHRSYVYAVPPPALFTPFNYTHAHTHTHTFLSCLRCRVFLNMSFKKKKKNKYADTVSLWAALAGRRLVSKVEHVCISRSTLWSSAASTFLKRCSCHLTPPHDFLCPPPCVCVCWPTTPLAILSSIVTHFLWTSRGMRGWPFENYGRFRSAITGDEHPKLARRKNSYCLRSRLCSPPQTEQLTEKKRGGGSNEEWEENKQAYKRTSWNQLVQMSKLVSWSRPSGAI